MSIDETIKSGIRDYLSVVLSEPATPEQIRGLGSDILNALHKRKIEAKNDSSGSSSLFPSGGNVTYTAENDPRGREVGQYCQNLHG
jgi:hypothetical protein